MGLLVKIGNYLQEYWRPLFALTYGLICLFDFVIMPGIYSSVYQHANGADIVNLINKLRPENQVAIVQILVNATVWKPITLAENGIFHLASGAILGASAWTRGQELIAQVRSPGINPQPGLPMQPPIMQPVVQPPLVNPVPVQPVPPMPPVVAGPPYMVDNPDV